MTPRGADQDAGEFPLRPLRVYNGGFLTQPRVRRILALSGWDVRLGAPRPGDRIGVWGRSPTAPRGEAVARWQGAPVLRVEDAFLRSVKPGRQGEPPLGLLLDENGVHFDASTPSDLETLLATHPLDDAALMTRARDGIERLRLAHLSKYTAFDPAAALPAGPYVVVVDQAQGDASIRFGGASADSFRQMLATARDEHPGMRIVIKGHPDTAFGNRPGHYGPEHAKGNVTLRTDPLSPWALFDGAEAVYTVSSQLGFEAILAGHVPRVFGQPFYAGWGLTADRTPIPRRQRRLTGVQLFAAAMILYPRWYDPYRDRLCRFEEAADTLEALTRAWREDRRGYVAAGMRLWKRRPVQDFLGREVPVTFRETEAEAVALAAAEGKAPVVWAGRATAGAQLLRAEDGFLRSRGLGAELIAPLSLVLDDLGIYYDPRGESRIERLIAASADLPHAALARAAALRRQILDAGLSKYNLAGAAPEALPEGRRILVPGQVEDDASILTGGGEVRTNLGLLRAVRAANPTAVILYKPHPDVEAGLRPGKVPLTEAAALADRVLAGTDPIAAIMAVDAVWTMTSLLGFEALLRGKPVTCLGVPFYAGWGLTTDLVPTPSRRQARPVIEGLIHAALIGYPRYHDPVTGLPCPPEVAVDRLAQGVVPHRSAGLRALAKLQGWLAGQAWIWRR